MAPVTVRTVVIRSAKRCLVWSNVGGDGVQLVPVLAVNVAPSRAQALVDAMWPEGAVYAGWAHTPDSECRVLAPGGATVRIERVWLP